MNNNNYKKIQKMLIKKVKNQVYFQHRQKLSLQFQIHYHNLINSLKMNS
jgi:hypothetical protein